MIIVPLIVTLFLFSLAIVIRSGKASWLIAGYNTMPKDEKAKYDEKAMCKFVGNLLFVLAIMQLLIGVSIQYKLMAIMVLLMILLFVVLIGAVVYMNTGNRFKNPKH